ncbi:MAG: (Fe-S)-binding protein [Bacteroidales bacterium]|nr:(Fe-S)-binding protein [Bacteroidales bacterium]
MEKVSKVKIQAGLEVLQALQDSKLITHLNSCVHCGLCAESCLYYIATGNEDLIPARKVDLVTSIYKRYCTLTGKIAPKLVNARDLDDDTISEMVDLLYGACTLCGRCVKHCSIGVDIEYVIRAGREMLARMDYVPASLQATVDAALESGNNMSISEEDFLDTIEWMEEELQDEVDDTNARIPVNESGKDVLYTLNPREPKFFPLSIAAMAKVFYAAKESWSLSTNMYDVTNYAYFSGKPEHAEIIAGRMHDEMKKMNAKRLVLAECGHGIRANRWEGPNYIQKNFPETLTSIELIADYIREGRIKTDKNRLEETVTLHDPCNLVRSGGIVGQQRYILEHTVKNFTEMTPHGIDNFCCGGGGGQLAMGEYNERRLKIAEIKADQIRKTGARIVVAPCHNCVDQLSQINVTYKLNVRIKTMAEIVADALVF